MRRRRPTPAPARAALPAASAALACAVLLCAAARPARAAATLSDYRARVRECLLALDSLAAHEEGATGAERAGTENRAVADVRLRLPRREQVEWPGGSVEVDNGWLHDLLASFERAPADARAAALARAAARLGALHERLAEAQEALRRDAQPRDKGAEKARLEEILRRPEFNQTPGGRTAGNRISVEFFKWLRSLFPEAQPVAPGETPRLTRGAQAVVYALGALVVGFVLWRYGPRVWRVRRRLRVTPEDEGARVVLGEVVGAEQSAADLLSEADELARRGDPRAAIRRAYVALLCELADRRVIRLARHKTNRDYLEAVRRARADLYPEVRPLTADFERHWYGSAPATPADWESFRARHREALQRA